MFFAKSKKFSDPDPLLTVHCLHESVTYAFIWAGKMPNRVGNPNIMPSASVNCSILMMGMLGLGGAFIFVSTSSLRDSSTWKSEASTPFASRPMYLQCVNYCGDYSSVQRYMQAHTFFHCVSHLIHMMVQSVYHNIHFWHGCSSYVEKVNCGGEKKKSHRKGVATRVLYDTHHRVTSPQLIYPTPFTR